MKNLRRILIAIKSPAARSQPALRKAAQIASASGARLTLFHAITSPVYMDAFAIEGMSLQQTQRQWRARAEARLEQLAGPLRKEGIVVDVSCEWDFPAYEAIIRRAVRNDADLIVAERHATRHVLPWLLRFNDWELLRRSPVPVLLIKRPQAYRKTAVLAAIDPSHSFAKPAKLDAEILAAANLMALTLNGKLHVAHAWQGVTMPMELDSLSAGLSVNVNRRASSAARAAFAAALKSAGISKARRHFVAGNPVDVLPALTRKHHVGIVVMGAVSRSGLKRLVVGNIAEQVLDSLSCDVLVLKPNDFKARVRSKVRGVQLVPTPT
ncbi:MAG: universal stress protein, partial [Steroidobacteraceae bacterium]